MIKVKDLRHLRHKLIKINSYPQIKSQFLPRILFKLRNRIYTHLFKNIRGSYFFYSINRSKSTFCKSNKKNSFINNEFYINGITISNNFLPNNEESIIKKSIEQLNTAIKNNVYNEKGLEYFYFDRTLPIFKPLYKNYYSENTAKRFYLKAKGGELANMFPKLFQTTKDVSESIFNKKYRPEDFAFEIISEYSNRNEDLSKINRAHVDRFFPAVKLIFSPFEITSDDSPFVYYEKSHIINKNYLKSMDDYIKKEKESPDCMGLYKDLKAFKNLSPKKILMKPNDLMLVATNGLHSRSGFETNKIKSRSLLFIDFYSFFKKSDLLFCKNQ